MRRPALPSGPSKALNEASYDHQTCSSRARPTEWPHGVARRFARQLADLQGDQAQLTTAAQALEKRTEELKAKNAPLTAKLEALERRIGNCALSLGE